MYTLYRFNVKRIIYTILKWFDIQRKYELKQTVSVSSMLMLFNAGRTLPSIQEVEQYYITSFCLYTHIPLTSIRITLFKWRVTKHK